MGRVSQRNIMKVYHVELAEDEGWYIGRVLERPGVTTQGRSLDELVFMVRDGPAKAFLASYRGNVIALSTHQRWLPPWKLPALQPYDEGQRIHVVAPARLRAGWSVLRGMAP